MSPDIKTILAPIFPRLEQVDKSIAAYLETGIPLIDNSVMHLFSAGGKKIRASLVLLSSGLRAPIPDGAVDLAAAVEIIHAASLVHDDIIDKSFMRRGNISVPGKYGDKVAVLAGDYMYSAAVNIAVRDNDSRILDAIAGATKEMVKGELYQIEYSNIDRITEERYYAIIERKTARLMAASCRIGGLKSGYSEEDCIALHDTGLNMGYAFQIIDDTFDFSDSSDVTGKDVGNDFKDGKITLPFIYILQNGTVSEKEALVRFAADPDSADWNDVRNLVHKSGAFEYSVAAAKKFAGIARERLSVFPDSIHLNIIRDIINFIVERNY
ncbi:MAG TPA: polyprenyl synthetase family protein [Spirochaetota bacterium]|nr:polyprenyl synthetase family protein [Spirochaetota bacterium]